jgi:uncharacterized lipoprotein YajG
MTTTRLMCIVGILVGCLLVACASRNKTSLVLPAGPQKEESQKNSAVSLNGKPQIPAVTVEEKSYDDYQRAKQEGRIIAERENDGYVFFAIKEQDTIKRYFARIP